MKLISTYIINLEKRKDRRNHILNEFCSKSEFDVIIYPAKSKEKGNVGLWETIREIISHELNNTKNEKVLICEDDHAFTQFFKGQELIEVLEKALVLEPELILGGVSWFHSAVKVSKNFFWLDYFNGFQFAIIYRSLFCKILEYPYNDYTHADFAFSKLTNNKFCFYPFISVQKAFGYSDITSRNQNKSYLDGIFKNSEQVLANLEQVNDFFCPLIQNLGEENAVTQKDSIFPLAIISKIETKERTSLKPQYEITKLALSANYTEEELWRGLVNYIEKAILKCEDLIIISDKDSFIDNDIYAFLITKSRLAQQLGAGLLTGISEYEDQLVYLGQDMFWVNSISSVDFLIIYKNLFQKILDYKFSAKDKVVNVLSDLTSNKLCLFPFVLKKTVNKINNSVPRFYHDSSLRFEKIKTMTLKFNSDSYL